MIYFNNMFQICYFIMGKAKGRMKGVITRARRGKNIKKPQKGSTQDCILISVSTSNSRKRQKQKELNRERVRQYRARQAELEKAKKTTSATKTSDGSKKN